MTWRLGDDARSESGEALAAGLDGGSIQFRTGSQPAGPESAASGTLCATNTFSNPAFGTFVDGVGQAEAITDDSSVDNSGTVEHARLLRSGGAIHSDASCGLGTGDFEFDNNVFVAGGVCSVSAVTITVPQS